MKANSLWETIQTLETDKYDYEQRRLAQDYELKELKERQKVQLRQKAMKKGLDPEALTGKHPPKIRMFSKYKRRTDTRTYGDRKKLYEGGWEVVRAEMLEAMWKDNTTTGPSAQKPVCPSGSARGQARRPETPRPPRARRRTPAARPLRRNMMKRKRKRRRRRKRRKKRNK